MACFKALCLGGVASLVASASAFAADLPVAQPLPAPPIIAPVVVGAGWYIRGDVGVGIADIEQRRSTFDYGFDQDAAGVSYDRRGLDDTAFLDAGVGYRFNNFLRADITGEYRIGAHYHAMESYTDTTQIGGRGYDNYSGDVRTVVGLVNGYIDLGTWYGVTPFVGAGVGIANVQTSNIIDQNPNGGFGYANDHNQNKLAWAVMAGLDFAITPSFVVELGYRHLDLGNVSTGTISCINSPGGGCHEIQNSYLAYNDIRLGFRYLFPVAAAAPVIARY